MTLDWDRLVARRAPDIHGWLKATLPALERMWSAEGLIYLSNGAPAIEEIPIARLRQAHADAWEEPEEALSYGDGGGYPPLRREIALRMAGRGVKVDADEILITNGSQQGLDLVGRALLDPGDVVIVEGPSYFGAMQAFDPYEIGYRVAPADEYGLIPEALKPLLYAEPRPKLIYTIPTFQNPTGTTIPTERRCEILSMAREASVAIVEDDPYGDIYFTPDPFQPLRALDPDVIYLGTFSKTLAPALRMGWMIAPAAVHQLAFWSKEGIDMMSDRFVQRAVTRTVENGWLDQYLDGARDFYRERRDALLAALAREMPEGVSWTEPKGGFFLWVTLPEGFNSDDLLSLAVDEGVGFLPGSCFFPEPAPHRGLRLSYPSPDPEKIAEGIRRLGVATRRLLEG